MIYEPEFHGANNKNNKIVKDFFTILQKAAKSQSLRKFLTFELI